MECLHYFSSGLEPYIVTVLLTFFQANCYLKKYSMIWSSRPGMFIGKSDLKICNKFIAEQPCRGVISKKLFCNFIEITLQHGCSPVNLLHIFRTPFPKKPLDSYFYMMLKISILWLYNITFLRIRVHCNKNYFLLKQICFLLILVTSLLRGCISKTKNFIKKRLQQRCFSVNFGKKN